jgi:hypothetical protein
MGMGGQIHPLAALPPGNRPGTHCIGRWIGPRAGLDDCEKYHPPPGFDPRTVQLVASRYTDSTKPTQYSNSFPELTSRWEDIGTDITGVVYSSYIQSGAEVAWHSVYNVLHLVSRDCCDTLCTYSKTCDSNKPYILKTFGGKDYGPHLNQ